MDGMEDEEIDDSIIEAVRMEDEKIAQMFSADDELIGVLGAEITPEMLKAILDKYDDSRP